MYSIRSRGPDSGQAGTGKRVKRVENKEELRSNSNFERPHSKAPSSVSLFHFLLAPLEPLNSFTSCGMTLMNGCYCSFKILSFYGIIVTAWLVSTATELSATYTWRGTSQPWGHPRLSQPWGILAVANSIIPSSRGRREMWWK